MVKLLGRHLSWHSPLLTTTPHLREEVSALDRFNVHHCPTRRVFSGTGLELVTRQATVRYLYHSATTATWICGMKHHSLLQFTKTAENSFRGHRINNNNNNFSQSLRLKK
ncbi:uncharacterized protein TNCV_1068951 [Trichonephila clavipes]|nr:uncharacterized protein TNCV_1068951 [Trichonephila clavipes]